MLRDVAPSDVPRRGELFHKVLNLSYDTPSGIHHKYEFSTQGRSSCFEGTRPSTWFTAMLVSFQQAAYIFFGI